MVGNSVLALSRRKREFEPRWDRQKIKGVFGL